jgi:fluoride exporter
MLGNPEPSGLSDASHKVRAKPRETQMKDRTIATSSQTSQDASDRGIDRPELLAIACGGAIGALIRIGMAQAIPASSGKWPWATFLVNIAGALMLGYFVTRLQERLPVSTLRRPLLATGLCGALTTFSTVQVELLRMADHNHYELAAGYLLASVLGGYFAVFASSALVRRVRAVA